MADFTEKIEQLLVEKLAEPDYTHLFLTEVRQLPDGTVHVFMDSDTGVSLEHCVEISRFLESKLDENLWLGDSYTLEVSSHGLDNPLKNRRQYIKNIGREVSVKVKNDYKNAKGKLITVDDSGIVIEYEERVAVEGKPKAKKNVTLQQAILWENVEATTVKISFK